jgi:hypothetical protein
LEDFLSDVTAQACPSGYGDASTMQIDIMDSLCFNLVLDTVEGHDLTPVFQDPDFIGHHIEFGYKDQVVSSSIEMTSGNKIDFKLNRIDFPFRLKDGSIFINLYENYIRNGQPYKLCVATRNLDLFTNVNHKFLNDLLANKREDMEIANDNIQSDVYYLKKISKRGLSVATTTASSTESEQYVKLNMSIHVANMASCEDLFLFKKACIRRKEYLETKMKSIRTKSSLYKKKLMMLVNPFQISLGFNEKSLFLVGSSTKLNKSSNGCTIF